MMKYLSRLVLLVLTIFNCSSGFAKSNDERFISFTDQGKGTALVFIHAYPTDHRLWQSQVEELQRYFRVVTLDLWGFGHSAPTDGQAVTMSEYADEVKTLLDKLHIQKAIIGGESMGGYVTLAFLEKYPHRVKGLILADTQSIADSEETKAKREATAVDVLENGTSKLINDLMPKLLSPNASEETKNYLLQILQDQPATAIASASRGMALRHDTSDLLAKTELPVLIITGDQDILISPQQSQNMHALAKNSRLVEITSSGHLSNLEQSSEWNKAVIDTFYRK